MPQVMKKKTSSTKAMDSKTAYLDGPTEALETSDSGILQLPFEIRTIIWGYIFADCTPSLVVDRTESRYKTTAYRVRSAGDRHAIYPPHPLCYVRKAWSAEVKNQLFNTILFRAPDTPGIWNKSCPKAYYQMVRLRAPMSQVVAGLQCLVSRLNPDDNETARELVLLNLPRLRYLEIDWEVFWPDADFDYDPGTSGYTKYQRTFTRLIFYKKAFEVNIKIIGMHLHPSFPGCVATVEGTSVTYKYHEDVRRMKDFERNVERVIFAGRSKDKQREFEQDVPSDERVNMDAPVTLKSPWMTPFATGLRNRLKGKGRDDPPPYDP